MRGPGILTLTTDFGAEGPYVGALKGIVLGLVPDARLVDVTHSIAPQDVLAGAYILAGIVDAFPAGTVHLAVVDPGVGTDRRLIAVELADQWFVLPDNGLMSGIIQDRTPAEVREIKNPARRRPTVSATFHGRDILAPAAAHLLVGGDPAELGPPCQGIMTLASFEPRASDHGFDAEVIFRDAFGNLITNVRADRLGSGDPWTIEVAGAWIEGLSRTYGDQAPGTLVALAGSEGWIEVAVVNGNAARRLSAGPGTAVRFRRSAGAGPRR